MINKLTQKVDDLDLVLGGHDCTSDMLNINNTMLCKSGTDFREFSIIKVRTNCDPTTMEEESHDSVINFKKRLIMSRNNIEVTKEYEPNIEMKDIISGYCEELSKKYNQIACMTGVDLDASYSTVRCKESNISNFVADVVRFTYNTDISIINSGALRINDIIPKGIVCWKEIDMLLPILEAVCRIRINGATLMKVLENGLSLIPELDGRFPCVSGMRLKYDSSKPPGSRICEVYVGRFKLKADKLYSCALPTFLYKGKDGYDALAICELVSGGRSGLTVNNSVVSFLKLLIKDTENIKHKKQHLVSKALDLSQNNNEEIVSKDENGEDLKYQFYKIYPKIDGRMTDVNVN